MVKTSNPRFHGRTKSRAYSSWSTMKNRCINHRAHNFKFSGGRGIGVCERWMSFPAFYEDMGDPPEGMTLDRIDNERGYSPENCRWAPLSVQRNNTRSNVYIEYAGRRATIAEWSREIGIQVTTIRRRRKLGWSVERIMTAPLRYYPAKACSVHGSEVPSQ
jgi:hypothetical protein